VTLSTPQPDVLQCVTIPGLFIQLEDLAHGLVPKRSDIVKIGRSLLWLVILILVTATYWFSFMREVQQDLPENRPVPVEIVALASDTIEETIELTGWIAPHRTLHIASKVAGRIESLHGVNEHGEQVDLEVGTAVTQGQKLAPIDRQVYDAKLAAARARVRLREIELANKTREKQRIVALHESGSITEQDRDTALTLAELAQASLSLAQVDLTLARINVQESMITSPITGIVTAKHVEPGDLVGVGQGIVTVADFHRVKVLLNFPDTYAARIVAGMRVNLRVDAYPEQRFEASIYSIYPTIDQAVHSLKAEVRLANPECQLMPGMFARVSVIVHRKENVIVVDRDVILGGKTQRSYVYTVQDNSARKCFVEVGIKQAARCEIASGLALGQALVVNGMDYLIDGAAVRVVDFGEAGGTE
jgi:membrane fusion protein, multidrug efflux system